MVLARRGDNSALFPLGAGPRRSPGGNMVFLDDCFATQYAGWEWKQSGLSEVLDWDNLPLASFWSPTIGATMYIIILVGLQHAMKNREPIHFPTILLLHNSLLAVASAVCCLGTGYSVYLVYAEHGLNATWADPDVPFLSILSHFCFHVCPP